MRSELSIKRARLRTSRALAKLDRTYIHAHAELYGVQQTLAWIMEDNAMEPVNCALLFVPKDMRPRITKKEASHAG